MAAVFAWARTAARYRDQLCSHWDEACAAAADDGGIGVVEWVNLHTGTRILAIAAGSWKTGGRFSVLHLDQHGVVSELRLSPEAVRRAEYPKGDPSAWEYSKDAVVEQVEHWIAADR